MGYKALITINLPHVTIQQREVFYQSLKEDKWVKLDNLDTAWKASFNDDVKLEEASKVLIDDLKKAKQKSKVYEVFHAFQMGFNSVVEGKV